MTDIHPTDTHADTHADAHACDGCPLEPSRRAFLQQTGGIALGVLLGLGVAPRLAAAVRPTAIVARTRGPKPTYPIPAKDGVQIDGENAVILVRWQNAVYAFNLSCPHQNTALRWHESDGQFQCPKHHSKYRPDGTFISGRATRGMDRFSLARSGDNIVVDLDAMHKQDADAAGWAAAVLHL